MLVQQILPRLLPVVLTLGSVAAAEVQEFFKWNIPRVPFEEHQLYRRVDGYHPEFGSCGSGRTCLDACGSGWDGCNATTTLSLFCYNKDAGQSCCANGSGRACDRGYYCAWTEINGKTWCCKDVSLLCPSCIFDGRMLTLCRGKIWRPVVCRLERLQALPSQVQQHRRPVRLTLTARQ
jgi:hypothetical protein